MTVLVTGASGFVGRALLARLERDAHRRVRTAGRRRPPRPAAFVKVGDIGAMTDWSKALRQIDAVVHLAARVHAMRESAPDPLAEFRAVNVEGTLALARQAAKAGVRRFVYLSSIKVNGDWGTFTEGDAPSPADPYAVSKWEAEQGLRAMERETGMDVVVVRPPLVYGPGVKGNFQSLLRAIARGLPLPLGAIDNRRSLIGVDNLADFIVSCLDHPAAAGRTFLVSDGEDLSTPELVRRLARAMNRPARLIPVPAMVIRLGAAALGKSATAHRLLGSLQVDARPAMALLSWRPPKSLTEGLRAAVTEETHP